MSIKILATADLHLGKASADVSGDFATTKNTWNTLVNWTIDNGVDVVTLSGDIIDRDNRYFEAVGPLQEGLEKLGENGIEVFIVSGNHDYDVLISILRNKKLDNVHLLGANGKWELLPYKTKTGETIQFVGWSFPSLTVRESAMTTWGKFTNYDNDYPLIGLLHGDVDTIDSRYNPLSLNELVKEEVDLWILGHIHKPNKLRDHTPQIWYTGSPHAMSAKETGAHGPMLFTVTGKQIIEERLLLSPVRYERINIDVSSCISMEELRDHIMTCLRADSVDKLTQLEKVSAIVYQVQLTGRHRNIKQVEQWAAHITDLNLSLETGTNLSVRKLSCNLAAEIGDLNELALQSSMIGQLAQTILAIQNETTTPFLEALMHDWFKKAQLLTDSGTYEPLGMHKKTDELSDAIARNYILTECNRLLNELTDQVKIA